MSRNNHGCAPSCCDQTVWMLEGECKTFCVDFKERMEGMCDTKLLDSRSPPPAVKPLKDGTGAGMVVSHEIECAGGKVYVKFDTTDGHSAGEYQVDVMVMTDSCQRTKQCFILQVKKCR